MAVVDSSLATPTDSWRTSSSKSSEASSTEIPQHVADISEGSDVFRGEKSGDASVPADDSQLGVSSKTPAENLNGKNARHLDEPAWKEPKIDSSVDTESLESSVSSSEISSASLTANTSSKSESAEDGVSGPASEKTDVAEEKLVESDVISPGLLRVEDHHPRSRNLVPGHSTSGSPPIPVLRHKTTGPGNGDHGTDKEHPPHLLFEDQIKRTASVAHAQEAKVQLGTKDTSDASSSTTSQSTSTDKVPLDANSQKETIVENPIDGQTSQYLRPPDGNSVSEDDALSLQEARSSLESNTPAVGSEAETSGDNMPSFSEWTQKRLAEKEQKGGNVPVSSSSQGKTQQVPKMRQKNYASADCGAKILATNPEAQSSYAVLNGYDDEYMLNPCTAKMWLVIELCEPIQAKKIEMANFELFSSSPREFAVYSSDRYPTRDWGLVGTFEAKEEKTIQSFGLDQKAFHKFIKIELTSHYGSEHYCPLSLVRLYGTSELEVLDTDDDNDSDGDGTHGQIGIHDQDGDSLEGLNDADSQTPNLFGSAKDAVMSIVKKAAEALSRDKNAAESPYKDNATIMNATVAVDPVDRAVFISTTSGNYSIDGCMTLIPKLRDAISIIVPSDPLYRLVNESHIEKVLSCSYSSLENLLKLSIIKKILSNCTICCIRQSELNHCSPANSYSCHFLLMMLGPTRFMALCHLHRLSLLGQIAEKPLEKLLPASGGKIRENASQEGDEQQTTKQMYVNATALPPSFDTTLNVAENIDGTNNEVCESVITPMQPPDVTPPLPDSGATVMSSEVAKGDVVDSSQSLQELIQPTKTLKPDDVIGVQGVGSIQDAAVAQPSESSSSSIDGESSEAPERVETTLKNDSRPGEIKMDGSLTSGETTVLSSELRGDMDKTDSSSVGDSETSSSTTESTVMLGFDEQNVPVELDEMASLTQTQTPVTQGTATVSVTGTTSSVGNKTSGVPVVSGGSPSSGSASGNAQKESVFVRLSNRIKALELNMSLSSQYLEELSQRYRKQMEEMQRAFNKTIGALNETAKKAQEQDQKQQEMIATLQAQINNLTNTVNALQAERENISMLILEPHVFVIFIELLIAACMYALLKRHSARYFRSLGIAAAASTSLLDGATGLDDLKEDDDRAVRRRNSFAGQPSPISKPQRRASEEALNIAGSYADLMIVEPVVPMVMQPMPLQQPQMRLMETKRRKHRHKKNIDHPATAMGAIPTSQQTMTSLGSAVQTIACSNVVVTHRPPHQHRTGSAGSLISVDVARKAKRAPSTSLTQNANWVNRWQTADRVRTTTEEANSGKVGSLGNGKATTETRSNCSNDNNRRRSCGLVCNGMSVVCNGRTSDKSDGSRVAADRVGNDDSVAFTLKKFFQKWFWFGR